MIHGPRHQWFINHIGNTIWRNANNCDCEECNNAHANGIVVTDRDNADYLFNLEVSGPDSGDLLVFFHSEAERDKWEATPRTVITEKKVQRNDKCPCGSGKKFKKCCSIAN